jgi:hypothetical protein
MEAYPLGVVHSGGGHEDTARGEGVVMPTQEVTTWQHSNKYSAESACEHCDGVVRHEPWCITRSSDVLYAYEAVLDADKLAEGDRLILHALGVKWTGKICSGACKSAGAY